MTAFKFEPLVSKCHSMCEPKVPLSVMVIFFFSTIYTRVMFLIPRRPIELNKLLSIFFKNTSSSS
jgi:hypothetical protein